MGTSWADDRDKGSAPVPPTAAARSTLVRPAEAHARRFRVVVLVQDELGTVAVGETDLEVQDQLEALAHIRGAGGVAADANPQLLVGR